MDPCLRRGGRLEREVDVTGSKIDRFRLLLALLGALIPKGGDRGLTVGGHFASAEDISRVADIVADRTGECSEWGACQPLCLSGIVSTWRSINYFLLSWMLMLIFFLYLSLLTPALSA